MIPAAASTPDRRNMMRPNRKRSAEEAGWPN